MNKPIVSIIISTYNDQKYLRASLESVINQTFKDWELIIINDASTDNTDNIIKEFMKKDNRIYVIRNKKNKGLTKNLNIGIRKSKGEYIARIDGDDIWIDKKKLEKQVSFLQSHKDYGLIGTWAKAIDGDGKELFKLNYPTNNEEIRNVILRHNCFIHSSVLFNKKVLDSVGLYNEAYRFAQDFDLWLKIGEKTKISNIPMNAVLYRINPVGTSVTKYRNQLGDTLAIIAKHKKNYPHYLKSRILWNLRKLYPFWIRISIGRIMNHV